jgi:hypothetical protein
MLRGRDDVARPSAAAMMMLRGRDDVARPR